QPHLVDVGGLARHVVDSHIDLAIQAELGADGRHRDTVLAGAGLGDDPSLAHPSGQQHLAERIVDLVRPGVAEVFPLQPERRATGSLAEPIGAIDWRRPPAECPRQRFEVTTKLVVALRGIERGRQFVDGRHQSLGDEPAAVAAKSPARVRPFDYRLLPPLWGRVGVGGRRHDSLTPRTAATKARSLAGSLRPGSASTPLQTSTPQGCRARTAPSTFVGVSPPETITG